MSKIKLRNTGNKFIKKLDKRVFNSKDNLINIKEKDNESSIFDYGNDKIETTLNNATKKIINFSRRKGRNSVANTMKNISNLRNKIKLHKAKKNIKTSKKVGKTIIKNTKRSIKTGAKITKKTLKAPKMVVKGIKQTIKTIKMAIKTTIKILKTVVTVTKAIIAALVAGGWIVVVIIIILCLIGFLLNSVFGIFLSSENTGNKTMSSVISDLNNELSEKLINIQNEVPHDDYVLNVNKTEWKYILSVYAVIISNGENATDVITINDNKENVLKDVFWKMNEITYNVQETSNENGEIKRILYINITGKSVNDMIAEYNLNFIQQKQMNELLSSKYDALWSNVVYGGGIGNKNVVDIALSQVGNVGGEPYWKWYGFNSRVEWCAIFVSWVYNEAGYLNIAVPKFSTCHTQGIPWFKAIGLWKEKGYNPKPGDVIFFDWVQDGHSDHVGIVERSDGKNIYTIEGNSRNEVKKKKYSIDSKYIYGYGLPRY